MPQLWRQADPLVAVEQCPLVNRYASAVRVQQTGQTLQGHALAGARRAKQHDSPGVRFEVNVDFEGAQSLTQREREHLTRGARGSKHAYSMVSRSTASHGRVG